MLPIAGDGRCVGRRDRVTGGKGVFQSFLQGGVAVRIVGCLLLLLTQAFDRWDELLGLIMRAFAYMDGVIDPPSSAHRLTIASLTDKARDEIALIAEMDANLVRIAEEN